MDNTSYHSRKGEKMNEKVHGWIDDNDSLGLTHIDVTSLSDKNRVYIDGFSDDEITLKKIVYNRLSDKLSREGMTAGEFESLLGLAEQWGVIGESADNAAAAMDGFSAAYKEASHNRTRCEYCDQWGESMSKCESCGARID